MKKLTAQAYEEIKRWVHQNARPIYLAVWRYHFEGGSADTVIQELAFYQNRDGGFGNALEPDNWSEDASPYTTLYALNILKSLDALDMCHLMLQDALHYLDRCPHIGKAGWLFSIPSNNDAPHAPWWTYDQEANGYESIGLTAELTGFILLHTAPESDLYQKAVKLAGDMIDKLKSPGRYGDMGIGGYCVLLTCIQKAGLTGQFDAERLSKALHKQVYDTIERDTGKWISYGVRPSNYIQSPDSPYYQANEAIVQAELDYLIDTRPAGGVWPISWSWFDNNDKYKREFAISENWWKAIKATDKVLLLKRFGRVDSGLA